MGTRGVEIFARPVTRSHVSDDPVVADDVAKKASKAAEKDTIPCTGDVESEDGLGHNENADSLIRLIVTAFDSDFFPVLLLLAIYALCAFGAALFVLLWWGHVL